MWFPRGRTVESRQDIIIRRKRPEDSVHLRCGIATRAGGHLVSVPRWRSGRRHPLPGCCRHISAIPPPLLGARQPLIQGVTGLHLPAPSGGYGSISRSFEPAVMGFSPIVARVLAHICRSPRQVRKVPDAVLLPVTEPDNLPPSCQDPPRGMHATIRLCDATRWRRVVDGRRFDRASSPLPDGDIDWHAERPGHL